LQNITKGLGPGLKLKKMDMRSGTWNVESLYRAGKIDLVGVQEVRWDRGGTEPEGEYALFYGKGNQKERNVD
jgi:hypothetical protein